MYLAIFSLFLGTLSIGTTEFVIAGLLPAVARDLSVSIPTAGFIVTGYALGVAIGGPILTLSTARLPRKVSVIGLMVLFVLGNVIVASASGFAMVMVGRVITSVAHGGFFGLAVVLAAGIAPKERVGTALSIIFAGVTIANIVGVPVGTAIGSLFGWRTAIWMVAGMGSLATIAIALFVPSVAGAEGKSASIRQQFAALWNQQVLSSYALIFLMMISFWSLNTFISPYLTEVVGIPAVWVSGALFCTGVGATVGIFIGGRLADRQPLATLRYSYLALVAVYAASALLAGTNGVLGIILVSLLAFPITIVATTVQNRVLIGARQAPDLAATLVSSFFNFGTATGSSLGATALAASLSYARLPLIGVAAAILASALAIIATDWDRQRVRSTAVDAG